MGKYRVEFEYVETDGSVRKEAMTVPLSPASQVVQLLKAVGVVDSEKLEGPWIVDGKPYQGDLADDEVARLRMLPGKEFSAHWRFTVKAL